MADEAKRPTEIEFFFEYDPGYRIVAANGVWGGITPRGDIQLDFFVERQGVPESVRNRVTDQGGLGDETCRNPEKRITRRLQIGVLLSQEDADTLADFLKEKVARLEKSKGAK